VWAVDDVVNSEAAAGFAFAPDGRRVVWVKGAADKDKNERVYHLFRTDLADGSEVQMTRGPESCAFPRWSPDGKYLAFLSARKAPKAGGKGGRDDEEDEAKDQLWLMHADGGEPWPLTEGKRPVLGYGWASPDSLVYFAQEQPGQREQRLKEQKDDSVAVEDEKAEPPVRLFRVAVKTKKVTRLTENKDRVESLAMSPDGRHAVALHGRSLTYTYDNRVKPWLMVHDLEKGTARRIFADARFNVAGARWSPDGKGLYVIDEHNSRPEFSQAGVSEPWWFDLATGKETKIDLGTERGLCWQEENGRDVGLVPLRDGFLALLADGARPHAARFVRSGDGWKREWLTGEHAEHIHGFAASADGTKVVYAASRAGTPTSWQHTTLEGARLGKPTPFAELNAGLGGRARPRVEVVRWKGGNDEEVEGLLFYPHNYEEGRKYPLVVQIHGGPASAELDCWDLSWSYAPHLLLQRGAFVLRPNYHGSTQYGLKWMESIIDGRYCGPELDDVEKGADYLIGRGLVDGERLALYGWSNGAILSNQLTTRSTRWKAAVVGAGNVEYVSDWATCEFGDAFDRYYLGKTPLEDTPLYLRKSPLFRIDKVRTPTLILHGTEDRVVHTSQGWVQFRALQQLAKTDVRFVLFPGAKHSLKKLSQQRRKLDEELAWFDKHLFHADKDEKPSLKAESPLAWALKRQKAARDGGRYGLVEKGKLIPEVVKHGGLTVGRFEVTRAQYAAFEEGFRVEAGTENYPANGVTFEQAQAYCAWLSRHTGRKYRLPTAAEAEELYDKAEENENTLDRWAGYAVNPEDAARLRELAKGLGGAAPLLSAAGGFKAVGEEGVFDLGGNVAEWVTTSDGKGELRGGSADAPADAKAGKNEAGAVYRGLRVVLEK
jgi:dipeptidyl aminopeptidase/acylaminoacyl peptidase